VEDRTRGRGRVQDFVVDPIAEVVESPENRLLLFVVLQSPIRTPATIFLAEVLWVRDDHENLEPARLHVPRRAAFEVSREGRIHRHAHRLWRWRGVVKALPPELVQPHRISIDVQPNTPGDSSFGLGACVDDPVVEPAHEEGFEQPLPILVGLARPSKLLKLGEDVIGDPMLSRVVLAANAELRILTADGDLEVAVAGHQSAGRQLSRTAGSPRTM